MWDPISPELAESFTLILPDNRGVGRSTPKRPPHTLADFSADLVELLDELQLDRVHVIGISLGGVIAQRLVVDHPNRVDRLVLISTAHRFGPYLRDVARLLGQSLYRMPYIQFLRTVELLGTAPCYYDAHADEVDRKLEMARSAGVSRKAVLTQLKCLVACDAVADEFQIDAPTLVLAGEYDSLIPNCYARQMADAIPGSEFRIVEGCGHNPATESPEKVIPLITEFLSRGRRKTKRKSTNHESWEDSEGGRAAMTRTR